jgi:WD40 repeat protein
VEVRVAADLSLAKTIQVEMDSVHDVRFSPDGRWLAVAGGFPGEFGSVAWIRWPSGELDRHVEVHDDVIHQVAFSADGTKWMTASSDEVCSVFAIDASKPSTRFTEHSRDVLGIAMLPDGETVVSGSRDETLRVWEAGSGKPIRTLHNHSRDVLALALQPNQRGLPVVASASADLTIRFWQPTIGRMVRFARLPSTPLAIAWVFEGRLLAAACEDGNVRLIDPVKVSLLQSMHVGDDWLFSVAEHPQQSGRVVVGGAYGTLRAEDLRS